MEDEQRMTLIGYSGFILFDECYEYNENACYLAASKDSIKEFMINCCGYHKQEFRVEEIHLEDLINDYGCSLKEYAMEQIAFERFKKVAEEVGLRYRYENYSADIELKVVNVYSVDKRNS